MRLVSHSNKRAISTPGSSACSASREPSSVFQLTSATDNENWARRFAKYPLRDAAQHPSSEARVTMRGHEDQIGITVDGRVDNNSCHVTLFYPNIKSDLQIRVFVAHPGKILLLLFQRVLGSSVVNWWAITSAAGQDHRLANRDI